MSRKNLITHIKMECFMYEYAQTKEVGFFFPDTLPLKVVRISCTVPKCNAYLLSTPTLTNSLIKKLKIFSLVSTTSNSKM